MQDSLEKKKARQALASLGFLGTPAEELSQVILEQEQKKAQAHQ